jgi:hypothetical protein
LTFEMPKYEAVSSHCARRTAITILAGYARHPAKRTATANRPRRHRDPHALHQHPFRRAGEMADAVAVKSGE